MEHYPSAKHYHLADSYAPVFGKTGYNGGLANWDMTGAYAPWIPGLSEATLSPWRPEVAAYAMNLTAQSYPQHTFASYVSDHDAVEKVFYLDEELRKASFVM